MLPQSSVDDSRLAAQHAAVIVALSKLPPFQPSALKLINTSIDSDSAQEDFEAAFKSDPALTADLLRVANSAEFGLRSRIETIRHAVAFVGLERVRSLGSTLALGFYVRNWPPHPYLEACWSHSLASAVVAEELGRSYDSSGLYTAGLVHDLGRLALFLSAPGRAADKLVGPFEDMEHALRVEKDECGMTHTDAGAVICDQWHFPPNLKVYMTTHHEPVAEAFEDTQNLVKIACGLAGTLGYPEVRTETPLSSESLPERMQSRPELAPERLREQIEKQLSVSRGSKKP